MLKTAACFVLAAFRGSTYGLEYASPLHLLRPRWTAILNIPMSKPGSLIEVECDPLVPALDLLPNVAGVEEVAVYGSLLHVVVDPSRVQATIVRRELEAYGIGVKRVEEVRPSLEDVF